MFNRSWRYLGLEEIGQGEGARRAIEQLAWAAAGQRADFPAHVRLGTLGRGTFGICLECPMIVQGKRFTIVIQAVV